MTTPPKRSVLILGAGVIGTACAHYLLERGDAVTIIEKGTYASGASHGNCGLISPSHVLPLTDPRILKEAWRALFARDAPFRIQPRFDPGLWRWLWKFACRCNRRGLLTAGTGIQRLLQSSLGLYTGLAEREEIACEWQKKGLLFVYQQQKKFEAYAATNRLLAEQFGEPAHRLDCEELCRLEPALKPGLAGGWYYEGDAHLRPDVLLKSWRQRLEDRGVTIHEHCGFVSFVQKNGRAVAARTLAGEIPADHFVVATGALTPVLSRELGCRIPIQPGKGYSLTMARPKVCPAIPLMLPEYRVAVTPMQTGYRLGSIMEFAGYDASLKPERLQLLRRGAEPFLHEPYCEPVQEQWFGWRPMTYDSLPIIDRLPNLNNVVLAAGHNMLGLSMAPATGKLVAELIAGETPHIDPQPYSLRRF
jgi:D-amino-acid dehydrogenase